MRDQYGSQKDCSVDFVSDCKPVNKKMKSLLSPKTESLTA